MYLIYGKQDGKVWREVHQYERHEDGSIYAGINGVNTLIYPAAVNVDVFEIPDDVWAGMDQDHPGKYIVRGGMVLENPDWEEPRLPDLFHV